MAAMVALRRQISDIVVCTYDRKNETERMKQVEYKAAATIQAWFRGCKVRSYLVYLNEEAIEIQRQWRGFLSRRVFRKKVKQAVLAMKMEFYNKMATKIQRLWRGYFTRKYVFNYYRRRRYLQSLQLKNDIIRHELNHYAKYQRKEMKRVEEKRKRMEEEEKAYLDHHLVSTFHIPGIYNTSRHPELKKEEDKLRAVSLGSYKAKKRKVTNPARLDYTKYQPTCLPHLSDKPQGPFRQGRQVQKLRYRAAQPSLRMATDFYALEKARVALKAEEWVHRLHDDIFQPFSQYRQPYLPSLHSRTPYGLQAYGGRCFREEQPEKHISSKPFKSQVFPIPTFDKVKDPYSWNQL